jgi:hypothetical protein
MAEIALVMGISVKTVEEDVRVANSGFAPLSASNRSFTSP